MRPAKDTEWAVETEAWLKKPMTVFKRLRKMFRCCLVFIWKNLGNKDLKCLTNYQLKILSYIYFKMRGGGGSCVGGVGVRNLLLRFMVLLTHGCKLYRRTTSQKLDSAILHSCVRSSPHQKLIHRRHVKKEKSDFSKINVIWAEASDYACKTKQH